MTAREKKIRELNQEYDEIVEYDGSAGELHDIEAQILDVENMSDEEYLESEYAKDEDDD